MVAKCTGIIPIIPDLVSASGMKIGAVYKRVYGFTDLRGRPAGRGRARHGPPNQVTAGASRLRPFFAQHAIHRHRPCRQRRGFAPRALTLGRSLTASRFAH